MDTKTRQQVYREKKKKKAVEAANKWRTDKKIEEASIWTKQIQLLEKTPIVVYTPSDFKKKTRRFVGHEVLKQWDAEGFRIVRADGEDSSVLHKIGKYKPDTWQEWVYGSKSRPNY